MGLGRAPKKPMVIPWLINRNGQSITLANSLKRKQVTTASAFGLGMLAVFTSVMIYHDTRRSLWRFPPGAARCEQSAAVRFLFQ